MSYIASRLGQMVIALLGISFITFMLVRLGGDPITLLAPIEYSPAQIQALREAHGLDKPLIVQYGLWLKGALQGKFGYSFRQRTDALVIVFDTIPATLRLTSIAALVALAIAVPLGVLSAIRRNSAIDFAATSISTVGAAMPNFWLGIMLILLFAVYLGWFPAFGAATPRHIIMPAVTIGTAMAARLSRLVRSSVLDVLNQDYVRTARAKGLPERVVLYKHALRTALIPVVTAFGLQVTWLLSGSVIVEQVFAWPGVGKVLVEAVVVRDAPIVQAGVFWFGVTTILLNLAVDVAYAFLDPRIRYR